MTIKLIRSFKFAYEGLQEVFRTQRSFRIQLFIAFIVILTAIFFQISSIEWIFILFAIALVLSFEMINTAIESTVDLITKEIHPKAKLAKDLSAGAVLVNAAVAFLVGVCIFVPRILNMF